MSAKIMKKKFDILFFEGMKRFNNMYITFFNFMSRKKIRDQK